MTDWRSGAILVGTVGVVGVALAIAFVVHKTKKRPQKYSPNSPKQNKKPKLPIPCIFCDNNSGSEEHLWPAWMHKLVQFAPIKTQEGSGPVVYGQDPQKTINTVCHECNNGWMSLLEQKNRPRLKPMLLNEPIKLDPGGMKLITDWAVKTAMVAESIKPRNANEQFFTRDERVAMRKSRAIPDRTRVWIGALSESHIGCHGTDYTLMIDGGKTRIGTGTVCTIYAGHFVVQTVTEHLNAPHVNDSNALIIPPLGASDERLVEIYPNRPKSVDWPPTPFTEYGPSGIEVLMARWRTGAKTDKINNSPSA